MILIHKVYNLSKSFQSSQRIKQRCKKSGGDYRHWLDTSSKAYTVER